MPALPELRANKLIRLPSYAVLLCARHVSLHGMNGTWQAAWLFVSKFEVDHALLSRLAT